MCPNPFYTDGQSGKVLTFARQVSTSGMANRLAFMSACTAPLCHLRSSVAVTHMRVSSPGMLLHRLSLRSSRAATLAPVCSLQAICHGFRYGEQVGRPERLHSAPATQRFSD